MCLGAKNPTEIDGDDPELQKEFEAWNAASDEALVTFEITIDDLPKVINTEHIDAQTSQPCEAIASDAFQEPFPEIRVWHDSPYFCSEPINLTCEYCNMYFCGPHCDYWWKRDYFEQNAPFGREYLTYNNREEFLETEGLIAHHAALDRLYEAMGFPFVYCDDCIRTDCPTGRQIGCFYGKHNPQPKRITGFLFDIQHYEREKLAMPIRCAGCKQDCKGCQESFHHCETEAPCPQVDTCLGCYTCDGCSECPHGKPLIKPCSQECDKCDYTSASCPFSTTDGIATGVPPSV